MKSNHYDSRFDRRGYATGSISGRNSRPPHPYDGFETAEDITFAMLYQRLAGGLRLLWIALKYRMMKLMGLAGSGKKQAWGFSVFKMTMLAVIVILVTQKEIKFSVNLKAPMTGVGKSDVPEAVAVSNKALGQFSLGDALPFGKSASDKNHSIAVSELDAAEVRAYIGRFSKVAVAEMRKFGIPASVKMAQAILESRAGQSPAVRERNNHFGRPLDQAEYVSAWENWRAHSLLLKNEYSSLFEDAYGCRQWAKGLQKLKYNSDRNYADKLMEIIEKYELTTLDE